MSSDWIVVMKRIESLAGEARDASRESDRLQGEVTSRDETIEALRKRVEQLTSLCDSLGRDNEECDALWDAELMKERNNEH